MAEDFSKAVDDGLKFSKRLYFGKDRAVSPPKQPPSMDKATSCAFLPTAPMVYAVISDPGIVDNPDIPSYQPHVHGRCDPPALIPLTMNRVELQVDCYMDTAFIGVSGSWRVHCIKGSKSCGCRVAIPMGEQVLITLGDLFASFSSLFVIATIARHTVIMMQHKTLAFVGDSLGRQQFQSLMCMITGGKERHDVIDVGPEYGIVQARGDLRPGGWAYRFPSTNTTILYYWSSTLCDLEPIDPSNPATDYAMHLDRPPAFLRQYIHKLNVLVLNTGHHWNRGKLKANRWVMHLGDVPNTDRKIAVIWKAKNVTVHSIINWVNSQLPKYPGLKAFYRTISPRHFVGGEWNTGGSCDNTTPMSIGKEVLQDVSSDTDAAGAAKGTGVKLLDITALSQGKKASMS
ncbi:hypothetical protein C1H46_020722 [Malus baccata]|uniref:Trichome birefringence-like C-terminal domain-containing protein n=1 Tax=Malus baccata TaxID=106549 RepID=A0A540M4U2_MALBA|nr:hypothetical protein C1H46_020722 [Malus baccata]